MEYIPLEQNFRANLWSKLASTKTMANNKSIIQEEIEESSIFEAAHLNMYYVEQEWSWQQPFWNIYLLDGNVLEEEKEATKLRWIVSFYTIVTGKLYHGGYSQSFTKMLQ